MSCEESEHMVGTQTADSTRRCRCAEEPRGVAVILAGEEEKGVEKVEV